MLGPKRSGLHAPVLQRGSGSLHSCGHILALCLQATGQILSWGDEWGDPVGRWGEPLSELDGADISGAQEYPKAVKLVPCPTLGLSFII